MYASILGLFKFQGAANFCPNGWTKRKALNLNFADQISVLNAARNFSYRLDYLML